MDARRRFHRPSVRNLTITDLLSLLEKDDHEVLSKLNNKYFGFEMYLRKRTYIRQLLEELEIIVEVLAKLCVTNRRDPRVSRLLRIVKKDDMFLFNDVPSVIHKCLTEKIAFNAVLYFSNYMIILKTVLKIFSDSRVVNVAFPALQNFLNRMKEMKLRNLDTLVQQFEKLKVEVTKYEEPSDEDEDHVDVVENFRKMSVVPREDDIVNCAAPRLPSNIIDASYKSVGHYLSVHFRLMREDMLRTFRRCVNTCLKETRSTPNSGRIYDDVQVELPPEYSVIGVCYNMKVISSSPINWEKTKSLMPGNIVCLTPNNFQTVVFVTIKSQTIKSKYECKLKACIEDDLYKDELTSSQLYLMIETNAYFESYRHVLSAIKDFSEQNFPLADVIAYLDYTDPVPEYITDEPFCLHEHNDCKRDRLNENEPHPCKKFNVLDLDDWPTAKELGLDEQQIQAFQTALTNKVAVIQGPPGTGKTFIGGKIVQAFLENVPHKPILISCVTNHALDQFLTLILKHTEKIVRLGSQSKTKVLESHQMGTLMEAVREYRAEGDACFDHMNSALKKSVRIAKSLAKDILNCAAKPPYNPQLLELRNLCRQLTKDSRLLLVCEEKYVSEDALNEIIDSKFKKQITLLI